MAIRCWKATRRASRRLQKGIRMKCKHDKCSNELTGRQKRYCSDRCRVSQTRTDLAAKPEQAGLTNPNIENYSQSDCKCQMCRSSANNGYKHTINHGDYKPAVELADKELNRVSLPGDPDYQDCCIKVDSVWMTKEDQARLQMA